ncbi:hypothetical protein SAMN05660706_1102 [Desulfoscipio geothermicus DSM 3669]|uniref:Uncharacterized protein n=1 Tax=Desulfoscipio geothermicus DSM 3669 TaxID=1121426 RepID=A0A1I6DFD1_9FIRM|nr:hypothetical protein SAMN05660706_1102 [Desulfoscipio geothermicus DSM 3669]
MRNTINSNKGWMILLRPACLTGQCNARGYTVPAGLPGYMAYSQALRTPFLEFPWCLLVQGVALLPFAPHVLQPIHFK